MPDEQDAYALIRPPCNTCKKAVLCFGVVALGGTGSSSHQMRPSSEDACWATGPDPTGTSPMPQKAFCSPSQKFDLDLSLCPMAPRHKPSCPTLEKGPGGCFASQNSSKGQACVLACACAELLTQKQPNFVSHPKIGHLIHYRGTGFAIMEWIRQQSEPLRAYILYTYII